MVLLRLSSRVSRPSPPLTTTRWTAASTQDATEPKSNAAQLMPVPSGSFIPTGPSTCTCVPAWTIVSVSSAVSPVTVSVPLENVAVGAASASAGAARASSVASIKVSLRVRSIVLLPS